MDHLIWALALMISLQTTEDKWQAALARMEVAEPYPELHVVDARHWMLRSGGLAAISVRYDSGREALYVSDEIEGKTLRDILDHEAAHFAAWRLYGESIPAHGPEWRRHCLARAERPKACKPTDFARIQ